jgi:hypothetical protein
MTTTTAEPVSIGPGQVERKPLMTGNALLMMNLGFFGVQFSFGLTQSAVNPLFLLIGASPGQLPILNLAGPVTALIWSRHHLQRVLTRYVEHYNTGRPHRGIDLEPPVPPPVATVTKLPHAGVVQRVDVLGGLIHEYRRAA